MCKTGERLFFVTCTLHVFCVLKKEKVISNELVELQDNNNNNNNINNSAIYNHWPIREKKENDPHSLFASTPSCKFSSPTGVSLEAGKLVLSVEAAATSAGPFFEG